jgi:hypothetical protein
LLFIDELFVCGQYTVGFRVFDKDLPCYAERLHRSKNVQHQEQVAWSAAVVPILAVAPAGYCPFQNCFEEEFSEGKFQKVPARHHPQWPEVSFELGFGKLLCDRFLFGQVLPPASLHVLALELVDQEEHNKEKGVTNQKRNRVHAVSRAVSQKVATDYSCCKKKVEDFRFLQNFDTQRSNLFVFIWTNQNNKGKEKAVVRETL